MARLTDRELDLIQQARRSPGWRMWDVVDAIVLEARRERARVLAGLTRRGLSALARITGATATARFLADRLILPIRRDVLRRRTVNELHQLEDHLLADIGIGRDDVERLAADLALAALPPQQPRLGLVTRLWSWLKRRATIRELEALDDRMLADIGLLRTDIPAALDHQAAPTLEQANYWNSVVRALRHWQMSREAAREIVRSDPDAVITLGDADGDFDWVPAGVAEHRPDRHEAA